jgi:hypothetical protein
MSVARHLIRLTQTGPGECCSQCIVARKLYNSPSTHAKSRCKIGFPCHFAGLEGSPYTVLSDDNRVVVYKGALCFESQARTAKPLAEQVCTVIVWTGGSISKQYPIDSLTN